MAMQTVTLRLPESIYRQTKRAAENMKRPLEQVLVDTLSAVMPPSVDDVPVELQEELMVLENLDDETLWETAKNVMSPAHQRKWKRLMQKNKAGTLTSREQHDLEDLIAESERIMLRRAHAYTLLKWRGHRLPTLRELQEQI